MTERIAYVILDETWDEQRRLATTYAILDLLAAEIAEGDFLIEWHIADQWPAEVQVAAQRLRDRFAPDNNHVSDLNFLEHIDGEVKADCLLVAPYAHDVALLGAGPGRRSRRVIAHLHDENTSNVFYATTDQYARIADSLGAEHVCTLDEKRRRRRASRHSRWPARRWSGRK